MLWAQTRMPALAGNLFIWKGNSYSPLILDRRMLEGAGAHSPTAHV